MPKEKKEKKVKDKKEKKDKSGSKSGLSTIASEATTGAVSTASMLPNAPSAGPAFDGGQMFERYASGGQMTPRGFMRMVQSEGLRSATERTSTLNAGAASASNNTDFEVGRLFARFGKRGDGQISSEEFKEMMRTMAAEGTWQRGRGGSANNGLAVPKATGHSYAATSAAAAAITPPEQFFKLPMAPETERIRAELNAHASAVNPMAATELHMLQMNLLSKKEHLMQQMRFVRARAEEVQSVRRAIERETLADAEAILHRLRGAESLKLSLLKHDMDQLQHDLDEIENFALMLKRDSATSSNGTNATDGSLLISTRSRYLEMCAEAERIASKPFKTSIDVQADDFDREVVERVSLATEVEASKEAAAVKDQMVWMLLREREEFKATEKRYANEVERLDQESTKEIEEWVRLVDDYRNKLSTANARIQELEAAEGAGRTDNGGENVLDYGNLSGVAFANEATKPSNEGIANDSAVKANEIGTPSRKGGWV
jgi:hypothetical protein